MLENMTTGEKALIGATALGIAALVFHKPTRNAVGLSDGRKSKAASKVLKLMDDDYSYSEALAKVLSENKRLNKKRLEKELDIYI